MNQRSAPNFDLTSQKMHIYKKSESRLLALYYQKIPVVANVCLSKKMFTKIRLYTRKILSPVVIVTVYLLNMSAFNHLS